MSTQRSESLTALATAMAKAQAEMPIISLDKKVNYQQVQFEYASLSNILANTKPILSKHGLSILQFPQTMENGFVLVETMLLHNSGESLTSEISARVTKPDDPKQIGSMISYLRRYAVGAVLGISLDGDYDAELIAERYLATPEHKVWLRDKLKPMGIDNQTMGKVSEIMQQGGFEMTDEALTQAMEALRS